MYVPNLSLHLVRAHALPRFAGVLVTLATLSACDAASRITSPPLRSPSSIMSSVEASNFAVLSNAAVTCTDGNITGNVATFLAAPLGSFTRTTCPGSSGG